MDRDQSDLLRAASMYSSSAREAGGFSRGAGVYAKAASPRRLRDDDEAPGKTPSKTWQNFPVEDFATWNGLVRTAINKPRRVAEFIHAVIRPIAEAKPNAAHRAIADMERHVGVTVVTQNIDNLHQEAGSTIVHEGYGSLFEVHASAVFISLLLTRRECGSFIAFVAPRNHARHGWLVDTDRAAADGSSCRERCWQSARWLASGFAGCIFPKSCCLAMRWPEPAWSDAHSSRSREHCDLP